MTYDISNNTFTNLAGLNGLDFYAGVSGAGLTGNVSGTVVSNVFGSAGDNTSGALGSSMLFKTIGSGSQSAKVTDNQMYGYGANSFQAVAGGDGAGKISPLLNLTFLRNTIANPRAGATNTSGFYLQGGIVANDAATVCANIGSGGANTIQSSGSTDFSSPFNVRSDVPNNGAFMKFTGYVGNDLGSSGNAEPKFDFRIGGLNGVTSGGIENFSGANRVSSDADGNGRNCALP